MAITSGKITHNKGTFNSSVFGPQSFLGTTADGNVSLSPQDGGYYESGGALLSPPINMGSLEASALGKLTMSQGYLKNYLDTLGLWYFQEGSGVSSKDLSGNNRTASLSHSTAWVAETGLQPYSYRLHDDSAGKAVNLGAGNLYPPGSGMTISILAYPRYYRANNGPESATFVNANNYTASGGGIQLTCAWSTSKADNTAAVTATVTARIVMEDGSDLVATCTGLALLSRKYLYASARWDGSKIEVVAFNDLGASASGASPTTSLKPASGITQDFTITGGATYSRYSELHACRILPFAVSDEEFYRNIFNIFTNTRIFFQTRTAASSGGFSNNWAGSSGDVPYLVSDFNNLWSVSNLEGSPLVKTDTPSASSNYPAVVDGDPSTNINSLLSTNTVTVDIELNSYQPPSVIRVHRTSSSTVASNGTHTIEVLVFDDTSKVYVSLGSVATTVNMYAAVDGYVYFSAKPAQTFSKIRIIMKKSAGKNHYAGIKEVELFTESLSYGAPLATPGLSVSSDTSTPGASALKISGSDSGTFVPIRTRSFAIPVSDFLQATMKCDNPEAIFKFNLHSDAASGAPSPTSAKSWSYAFKVKDPNWRDYFFPDFTRTDLPMTGENYYWMTLEVVDAAGGFNLWLDNMEFRRGLTNGGQIQSPINDWLQYRAILLTIN